MMNKLLIRAVTGLVFAGVMGACAPEAFPVAPTHAPFALATLIPPTPIPFTPTATETPTSPPATATSTLPPTDTRQPTVANTPALTQEPGSQVSPAALLPIATPTLLPSPTRAPSATPAVPRGVYVMDVRIDPPPVRGPELKFYPTFLNTLEGEQNYRWAVYIFRADNQRRTGETTRMDTPVSTGTSELESVGSWKLPLGGPCDYFYAQVGWAGTDNQVTWFTVPNGSLFQKGFAVCPP